MTVREVSCSSTLSSSSRLCPLFFGDQRAKHPTSPSIFIGQCATEFMIIALSSSIVPNRDTNMSYKLYYWHVIELYFIHTVINLYRSKL